MHVGYARLNACRLSLKHAAYSCGLALACFLTGANALQNAVAEGDTRTISLHHMHTGEDITITFKRDGRYDEAALEKLNWFLRDWRKAQQTQMDPHLIDLVWEVQHEAAPNTPIQVVCGYRSPETNAMLRHRSANTGVARFSQHMLGHAMDFYLPGVPLEHLREFGLRLERGGVGFYPESGSPFVHMDTGGVRMWPRMTHEQLARVFPDGRTVQIPTDGKPLSGYALALADIRKHGAEPSQNSIDAARTAGIDVGTVVASSDDKPSNPFARLLGLVRGKNNAKSDDDEDDASSAAPPAKHPVLAAIEREAKTVAQTAEKATAKAATKVAEAASKVKLIRVADASPLAATALAPAPLTRSMTIASAAPTTPNQIIADRGYWQGPVEASAKPVQFASAAQPLTRSLAVAPAAQASARTDTTGSISSVASQNAPQLALGYAEQPSQETGRDSTGILALRAAALPQQITTGTSIAMKRGDSQTVSTVVTQPRAPGVTLLKTISALGATPLANPWLRAMTLSPSVYRFLTIATLGARDFRTLSPQMIKPPGSVMMTFAADPNPGLDHDHFSGSAVVFVSTVSYALRTASLQ
ncbi:MAG TPA: DUF882 domain-containing protein [Xanthobacteraceae bacterium]|nr:DUF882 domain-containing protein [Xanthobacteraceae bacterium]